MIFSNVTIISYRICSINEIYHEVAVAFSYRSSVLHYYLPVKNVNGMKDQYYIDRAKILIEPLIARGEVAKYAERILHVSRMRRALIPTICILSVIGSVIAVGVAINEIIYFEKFHSDPYGPNPGPDPGPGPQPDPEPTEPEHLIIFKLLGDYPGGSEIEDISWTLSPEPTGFEKPSFKYVDKNDFNSTITIPSSDERVFDDSATTFVVETTGVSDPVPTAYYSCDFNGYSKESGGYKSMNFHISYEDYIKDQLNITINFILGAGAQ